MGSSSTQSARSRSMNSSGGIKTPQKTGYNIAAKAGQTPEHPVDLTDDPPSPPSKKRKAVDLTLDNDGVALPPNSAKCWSGTELRVMQAEQSKSAKKPKKEAEEKRVRRFRPQPPQSFHEIYARALSQRFYVLNRTRYGTEDCPEEEIEMTGSTGNIYTVTIGKSPRCTCPHNEKGHQCKHILYVMKQVLNAPFDLVYQLGLLSSELRSIFAAAPPISAPKTGEAESDKRKPIEGDCPICYCELEADNPESIVWCAAACGQNIHEQCFKMWARTKGGSQKVTCPMCRSVWKGDEDFLSKVRKDKGKLEEGYVNVADQLGVSRVRDESTYSRWHGRNRWGYRGRR
ncbi:hypothetical protein ACJ41O_001885 [Fusarium nematophilum]